ncbi:MAG: NTP transferase domain-containing protein [bacterium]|nr:NTP transferase domain-containing protein [bacterium]
MNHDNNMNQHQTLNNAVCIVQARMGSRRLPGKMMEDLAGRPLVWHILQRAQQVGAGVPVVLATTDHDRDDQLVAVAEALKVAVVRGSEHDVLGRFLLALEHHPARWVARVCGDSPLFDPVHLARWLEMARRDEADVVRFREGVSSLQQGCEVISARALRWSREAAGNDPLATEHVTAWALRHAPAHPELMVTAWDEPPAELVSTTKLSIDTADDLARMRRLYAAFWDGGEPLDLRLAAAWLRAQGGAEA